MNSLSFLTDAHLIPELPVNRRPLPIAAALAATAALLLTACGSGDDIKPEANGKVAGGAEQGDKKPSSPEATAPDSTGRPKIELPADIKYVFEWSKTGDTNKDAVLRDGEQFIKATDMAVAEQEPLHRAYSFYSEGEVAASTQTYIQAHVDRKIRTTGTYRFYDAAVALNKDSTASLVYCEDQGKALGMNIKTGKIDRTPVTEKSYVLYNAALRKNKQGIWVTTKMFMQRGNAKCQP